MMSSIHLRKRTQEVLKRHLSITCLCCWRRFLNDVMMDIHYHEDPTPILLSNWSAITYDNTGKDRCQVNPNAIPDFGGSGVLIQDSGRPVVVKQYCRRPLPFKTGSSTCPTMLIQSQQKEDIVTNIHPAMRGFNWNLVSSIPSREGNFVYCVEKRCLDLVSLQEDDGDTASSKKKKHERITRTSRLNIEDNIVDIHVQSSNCLLHVNSHSKVSLVVIPQESMESMTCLSTISSSELELASSSSSSCQRYFKCVASNPFIDNELVSCLSTQTCNEPAEKYADSSSYFQCMTDDVICLIDVERGQSKHSINRHQTQRKSHLLTAYPSQDHPRHVITADKHNMYLIDSRIHSAKKALLLISDDNRNLYAHEAFQGCLTFPMRPQQHLTLTNYHVGLVDERFPARILLQWSHSMDTDCKHNMNFLKVFSAKNNNNNRHDKDTRPENYDDNSASQKQVKRDSCLVCLSNASSVCMLSLEYLKGLDVLQPYSPDAPLHVFHLKECAKQHSFSTCHEKLRQDTSSSAATFASDFSGRLSCLTGLDIVSPLGSSSTFSMIGLTERGDVMIQDFSQ